MKSVWQTITKLHRQSISEKACVDLGFMASLMGNGRRISFRQRPCKTPAGKTYEMVATAMESKRLGLCSKSMFVVPNNIIGDFAADFLDLYPSANILMATKKDFGAKNRKKFCARIATGDYDVVLIGHSSFEKIPVSMERQQRMINQQIYEITEGISEAKANDGARYTIKQMEKTKKSLQEKLKRLTDQSRKDDLVTFLKAWNGSSFISEDIRTAWRISKG